MQVLKRDFLRLIVFIALTGILTGCNRTAEVYKILLIQSYDSEYTKAALLEKGVKDYFKKKGVKIDLNVSYLDCEIKNANEEIGFLRHLMDTYRQSRLDLIIVCDDQATFSLLETEHPLTFKVPIVFCGVDYFNPSLVKGHDNLTGLTLRHDFNQCVHLAKRLFSIDKIYFLTDETFLGKSFKTEFENQLNHRGDSLKVEYMNATFQRSKALIHKFNSAPPNSMIIIPRYDNIYPLYSLKTSAPVFVMSNEAFNDNILGGYVVSDEEQTAEAAKIALEILEGKQPGEIPVTMHHQQMIFNWNGLKKWKVDESALPPGSIIINIPFFEQYKYYIITGSILLLFLVSYLIVLYIKEHRQKKQAQRNLIKQRNEYDITLRALCEGVISVDCNGKIFGINKKALELLDLNASENICIGRDIHTLLTLNNTKDHKFCLAEWISQAIETNKPVYFPDNTFVSDADCSFTLPVSGEVASIYNKGIIYGIVIVFRDISNEYTQKELLELTFNESKVYPWMFDVDSQKISYGNNLFNERNASVSLFEDFSRKMHPDDIPVWRKNYHGALEGLLKRGSFQIRMKTRNNGYEWWEYRFSSMPDTAMKPPARIFGICVNIEDAKKKEAELVLARDMAAKAELKQSFLANMSHEIRTPLNAIVGFSNLLVEMEELNDNEKREFALSINKNCEQLLKLVSDILEMSRMDSGNMSFNEELCEINPLLKGLYSNISILIPDRIKFVLDLPPFPVTLLTDPLRLTQVLTNFLNNALKFTQKGKITLGYSFEKEGFIDLFVEDTGKGIPDEEQTVIFDRFYKCDEFAQGSGLGLAICKVIAERLGGDILLKSKVGEGSRFIIRLPNRS